MNATAMQLRVLLPHGMFLEQSGVTNIVAETEKGFFGLLPQRLDCSAALVPGILTYKTQEGGETEFYVAVDEGILLKTGPEVTVAVRHATTGNRLGELRKAVDDLYESLDESEKAVRSVLAKLESHFVRRLIQFGNERSA